jgi:hypothetical protein
LLTAAGLHVPVMPFADVVGKPGTVPSAQIVSDVPNSNAGITFGLTVTVNEVVVAHDPAVGVKVYVPEFWLSMVDGLHVPVMLLEDVVGSTGTVASAQIDNAVPKLKVGVMLRFTVTEIVAVVAQKPSAGKNVYVPDSVLLISPGNHVPVILFADNAGKTGTFSPEQIVNDVPKSNVGTVLLFTVTVNVMGDAQRPGEGVNV